MGSTTRRVADGDVSETPDTVSDREEAETATDLKVP